MMEGKSKIDIYSGPVVANEADTIWYRDNALAVRSAARAIFKKWLFDDQVRWPKKMYICRESVSVLDS